MNKTIRWAVGILLALLAGLGLTGCQTHIGKVSTEQLQRFPKDPDPVYVTNPELKREYEILKGSGIFQLTDDPAATHQLTLRPLAHMPGCGNPMLVPLLTLGILPGQVPGNYLFEYILTANGETKTRTHLLPVYARISIWEWLISDHDDERLAEGLAWSTLTTLPYTRVPPNH